MNAFNLHRNVIDSYREYLRSFLKINDKRILNFVVEKFDSQGFIPDPIIQFNPSYERSETLTDLYIEGKIDRKSVV